MSHYGPWTNIDDGVLQARYRFETDRLIARRLNRTATAVRSRASKLGLRKSTP